MVSSVNNAIMSKGKDDWLTPFSIYIDLDKEFEFTLDPCADIRNPHRLCDDSFTIKDDGLIRSWRGQRCFVNPPYSGMKTNKQRMGWVEKCSHEVFEGGCEIVVMLIPARTDTQWFHDFIYEKKGVEIRFRRGRTKFVDCETLEALNSAPFPSMVVIMQAVHTRMDVW